MRREQGLRLGATRDTCQSAGVVGTRESVGRLGARWEPAGWYPPIRDAALPERLARRGRNVFSHNSRVTHVVSSRLGDVFALQGAA